VKFLLNMNIAPGLGAMLVSTGHESRHAADIGMSQASDATILAEAKSRQECVITHDLDYGQLLAFSGDSAPSVLIFRLRRANTELMHQRITGTWSEIEEELTSGAVVVIEEAVTRIRRLPIANDA
jgi:predicted nuclease of predicted toxin-antitoxin system